MSVRHTWGPRRGAVAAAMTVAVALTVAGCGGDSQDGKAHTTTSAQSSSTDGSQKTTASSPDATPTTKLAETTGQAGMVLTITSVKRDSGGFVTVSGQVKNTGSAKFYGTASWAGTERDVLASGQSVAGATLVDKVGKKRYYVLRDTGGKCLCTMGILGIEPGQAIPFFAQFPAPPSSAQQLDFQLPTFPTMTVPVSG
ncbi:hypothetical protein GCM10010331_03070 [Streptomyces xanthochromogenes]|nr:hypothetical protein GCM10010331_03070 [Streptomyces xanthochromogenes]